MTGELSNEVRRPMHAESIHVRFFEDGELFYYAQIREDGHNLSSKEDDGGVTVGGERYHYVHRVVAIVKRIVWGEDIDWLHRSVARRTA